MVQVVDLVAAGVDSAVVVDSEAVESGVALVLARQLARKRGTEGHSAPNGSRQSGSSSLARSVCQAKLVLLPRTRYEPCRLRSMRWRQFSGPRSR